MTDTDLVAANAPKLRVEVGREGMKVAHGSHAGCGALAVFCSGGDAQGTSQHIR